MADTQVTFDILARDRASRPLRRVGDSADRASDRFRSFGRVAGRVARTAGVALGGAAVVVAGGLVKAAKAAAEEEQEMAVLANTLRKSAKATDRQISSTEDWITSLQNATGVADGELRPALGKLAIATGDIAKAQDLLKVALDVSAARGKSLGTVTEALGKAAQGSTWGLQRLGIATKGAGGEALTFDEILQNVSKTMGGAAAAAADTTAGRFQILKARFADLQEEIGARLLPYLNRLGKWFLDKGIPALERFGRWFRDELWPALRDFSGRVGEGVLGFFQNLGDALGHGGDGAKNFKGTMRGFGKTITDVVLPAMGRFIEETLPALGRIIGEQIDLTLALADAFVSMALIGMEAFNDLVRTALNSVADILHALQKITFGPMGARIDHAAERFDRFRERTISNLDKTEGKLREVKEALDRIRSKTVTVGVNYITSGKFAGKALPIDGRASGGPVRAGQPYIVGERRPELFVPNQSGTILPKVPSGVHIENLNVTSGPGERAEQSVPRALRQLTWAF